MLAREFLDGSDASMVPNQRDESFGAGFDCWGSWKNIGWNLQIDRWLQCVKKKLVS